MQRIKSDGFKLKLDKMSSKIHENQSSCSTLFSICYKDAKEGATKHEMNKFFIYYINIIYIFRKYK